MPRGGEAQVLLAWSGPGSASLSFGSGAALSLLPPFVLGAPSLGADCEGKLEATLKDNLKLNTPQKARTAEKHQLSLFQKKRLRTSWVLGLPAPRDTAWRVWTKL